MNCNDPTQNLVLASLIAGCIAQDQCDEQLAVLSELFRLVGDSLAYCLAQRACCGQSQPCCSDNDNLSTFERFQAY